MSLSQKIAAAVDDLAHTQAPALTVTAEDGPYRLALELGEAGRIGLECASLQFRADNRPEWSVDELRSWGARLSERLSYLMEPLVFIESDPIGVEVELRSKAPTARNGSRSYYEVRLSRDGQLRLGRVRFDETTRRRCPTPFQLTREVLERLADDLVASVA